MSLYELLIGRRYLRSGRGNRFVSLISIISMVGVTIGVAVLIVVLSVMNGFEAELRERMLSMTAHATIRGMGAGMSNWQALREASLRDPEVVAAAPYIEDHALLLAGDHHSPAAVVGVLPEEQSKLTDIRGKITEGSFDQLTPGTFGIVLGAQLAESLGVTVGSKVQVAISQTITTPLGVIPRNRVFKVIGIFSSGMYEFDKTLAYVHLRDAAKLYRMGDEVSGLRLKLADMFLAPGVVRELGQSLGGTYYVDDWTRQHTNFFRSIQLAKSMMFLMLLLVVAVATFNIVSTLVMRSEE